MTDGEETATDATAPTDTPTATDAGSGEDAPGGRREVVVPERLYRTVTVFSTLIAFLGVVLGFILLDAATQNATVPIAEINPWLAALGLLAILGGGAVYAYAARFRAAGMRKDKDATDEPTNNG